MKKYFKALDRGASWDVLSKYRPGLEYMSPVGRFLLWYFGYKWFDPKREYWESIFRKEEKSASCLWTLLLENSGI